jgi:outer membrane biosynthesis protein TonB
LTLIRDKNLQTGIAGSLAVHAVLLLLLTWGVGVNAVHQWQRQAQDSVKVEPEVTLLFPDLIIPPEPEPAPAPPPPPVAPQQQLLRPFVRSGQSEAVQQAPAGAVVLSDRNMVAASKRAPFPDATMRMPTLDGIAERTQDLVNREFRDGKGKKSAAAKVAGSPSADSPNPETAPKPLVKMKEATEAGHIEIRRASKEPPTPANAAAIMRIPEEQTQGDGDKDAFSPMTRASAMKGTISNRGEDAVNAERTPLGGYISGVNETVEKRWNSYRLLEKSAVPPSNLKVRFFVTKNGKVEDLKILSALNGSDRRLADFTLRAIKDAEIPPIPADVLPMLEGERVKIEYDVLIY